MKNSKDVFRMTFLQIIKRPCLYLSIAAIVVICFLTIEQYTSKTNQGESVAYLIELIISLSMTKKLLILCASFACVPGFCTDWNSQFIKMITVRSGIKKYTFAKVSVCFMISFLTVFIGMAVFAAMLSLKYTIVNIEDISAPFGVLAEGGWSFFYPLSLIWIFAMSAAAWASVGLMVSSYIPNSFVAIMVPIVSSYIFEEITNYLPPFLNLYLITRSVDVIGQGALSSFVYFTVVFLLIVVAAGVIFHYRVKRRVRNEIV